MINVIRKNIPSILIYIVLGICATILSILNIKFFQDILDQISINNISYWMIGAYGVTLLLGYIINYISEFPGTKLKNCIYLDIKVKSLEKLKSMKFIDYQNLGYGQTLQIIESGAMAGQQIIFNFYLRLFREILPTIILSLIAIYFIEYRIVLFLLLGYILVFIVTNIILKKLYKIREGIQDNEEEMNFLMTRSFMEMPTFRLNNVMENQIQKIKSFIDNIIKSKIKMVATHEAFFTIFALLIGVIKILIIVMSIIYYKLDVSEIVALTMLVDKAYTPIAILDVLYVQKELDKVAFNRLKNFLSLKDDTRMLNGVKVNDNDKGNIQLKNINYLIQGKSILNNINLSIKSGDKFAIVGKSGSGKSTLLKLIMGLVEPVSGDVSIDKINLEEIFLPSYYKQVNYLTQETPVFKGSIMENLLFDKSVAEDKIHKVLDKVSLSKFILKQQDGLQTIIGEKGSTLSGGERQRLALARLYFSNSKIIVLDEATSALDHMTENSIFNNILDDFKDRTVIIITHRIKTLEGFKNICYLEDNCIREVNSYENLYKKYNEFRNLTNIKGE